MQKQLKLVFLVISADSGIYAQLHQYWLAWAAQNRGNLQTFLVLGDPDVGKTCLRDDMTIITPRAENYIPGVLDKTIDAMQFIKENHDFDYLVRTNLSSFWFNENLLQHYFSSHLEESNCYAGYVGKHQEQLFVSGAGIIISPDVIERLVTNRHLLNRELPDDVAIGRLLQQYNLAPLTPLQESRYDIVEYQAPPDEHTISGHLEYICNNNNLTHVRLKNPDRNTDLIFFRKMLDLQWLNLKNRSGYMECRI